MRETIEKFNKSNKQMSHKAAAVPGVLEATRATEVIAFVSLYLLQILLFFMTVYIACVCFLLFLFSVGLLFVFM